MALIAVSPRIIKLNLSSCWWQLYYLLLIKEEGMGVNMLLALPIKIGLINLSFVSEIFYADILVTKNEARSL